MKKTRVLLIRNSWGFGGAEKHVLELAKILRANGFTPIVSTSTPSLRAACRKESIPCVGSFWYKRQGWGRIYHLLRIITPIYYVLSLLYHRIDIVHAHGRDDFIFATKAANILHKRIIWTDHGDLKYIIDTASAPNLRRLIIKRAKSTAMIIAVSIAEKKLIIEQAPELNNIIVIYNGVSKPARIQPAKRDARIIITSTSRLVDSKGMVELIHAFSKLKTISGVKLWLVGSGEGEVKYRSMIKKLGIEKNVDFWGFQENVWPFLAASDIFVHPSHIEAFGISIAEASALAIPVIATNVGGIPEIVDNTTGILVPPNDVNALRDALEVLISNKTVRDKLGKAGAVKVENEFNFEKNIKDHLAAMYGAQL